MKLRFLFSLLLGATLAASAQGGYQDGVDNYNAGRPDVAKAILTNTLNDFGTDKAVSYFYLGSIAFDEGNLAEAKNNFDKGVSINPQYPYNYIGQGEVALKNGNKGEAERMFKQAMEINKKNTAVMVGVARAYFNVNPTAYAKDIDKLIAKALKESKNSEAAVYVLQGDMQAKTDPGEAAGKYEMAIVQDQGKNKVNREAYVKYANTYFHVNPKFAIDKLVELNDLEPNSALAQRELAEKYYANDQFGSACLQYGKYVANPNHFPSDEARYAGLLYSAGEYNKSIEWADKILASDPNNFYMYRVIMLDKSALKDWAGAEEAGKRLFNNPEAQLIANDYVLYADALSQMNKPDEAVAIYEKAIELNPDKADLLPKLSAVYDRAGQNDKAVEVYKKYLDMGNGTTNDLFSMARRYQGLARSLEKDTPERAEAAKEGLKYIDMAIAKVNDNGFLYATKGQLLLTLTNDKPDAAMAQAYEDMLKCFDADPSKKAERSSYYTAAYYLLGAYYTDVDKAKAIQYFNDYLTLHPDDEAVKQMVASLSE